ncbi:hypothetical protein N0V84_003269 [Fusarium piperis]|uniref:DUF7918 domain-containing protein n=1 Tax=Fusarium piperis TaxID=1435070 RepID=A0A9W8WI31_9HYPO|nr:hypothetical protein N0V84_003269 [Fusarium piperis]
MAVLAGIPQVSVKVRVAGEIATEYEAPSDQVTVVNAGPELPTTHCYIEAKSGAKFGIEMTVDSCFPFPLDDNAVAMFVYIDGAWMKGVFIRSDSFLPQETAKTMEANDTLCRADQEGGEPLIKDFMFSPIVTSMRS